MATLAELFIESLGDAPRPASDLAALDAALARAIDDARARWPGVDVAPELYVRHLASRVPDDTAAATALAGLETADLYLACACARGVARAIELFDAHHFADLAIALRRLRLDDAVLDEVKQQLRVQLFVPDGDELPDIALYAGRGELRLWVRSTGVRAALKLLRRDRRLDPDGDDALAEVAADVDDPLLVHLKQTYAAEFKAAFGEAVAALTPRQRNLLRHHLVDALSIDEVGRIYRVHRATAARWVAGAREELMATTLRLLRGRLAIAPADLESIVRLVRSQLDLSIHRVLGARERQGSTTS